MSVVGISGAVSAVIYRRLWLIVLMLSRLLVTGQACQASAFMGHLEGLFEERISGSS